MSSRRKPSRKRPHQSKRDVLLWITCIISLIFGLCLCAFNFELASNAGQTLVTPATSIRLEVCRSSCDERVHSAALERSLPSSLSSSAMDTLILFRDADDRSSIRRERESTIPRQAEPDRGNAAASGIPNDAPVRPRRLPPLIKTLTGFEDEPFFPYGSGVVGPTDEDGGQIIRLEKPLAAVRPRRRRGDRISSEETVQMAAAAAAAAVWAESARTRSQIRMKAINAEWEAALRWIAGWDQQLSLPSEEEFDVGAGGKAKRRGRKENELQSGETSLGGNHEEFDDFIDDLARLLERCIVDCLEDPNFDENHQRQQLDWGIADNSLVGGFVVRTIFTWITGLSIPAISFGKLDLISPRSKLVAASVFHVVVSSIALYAFRSLYIWGSVMLANSQESSMCTTYAPEWLIEHEQEVAMENTSRYRQKKYSLKKPRKKHIKQFVSKDQTASDNIKNRPLNPKNLDNVHLEPIQNVNRKCLSETTKTVRIQVSQDSADDGVWLLSQISLKKVNKSASKNHCEKNENIPSRNDLEVLHNVIEAPSSSSVSTSSLESSSPPMKPIGSQIESQCLLESPPLQGTSPSILGWNSPLDLRAGVNTLPTHQLSLAVPTQEQRNAAANRLREYQAAQIQRIVNQQKLGQVMTNASTFHLACSDQVVTSGNSSLNTAYDILKSGQLSQSSKLFLQPPPGITHPSTIQTESEDLDFLTDSELLLSKLLDDDDDDDSEVDLSHPRQSGSISSESSLDPSAAPFVAGSNGKTEAWNQGDSWSNDLSSRKLLDKSLTASSNFRVGGVYGGSVW